MCVAELETQSLRCIPIPHDNSLRAGGPKVDIDEKNWLSFFYLSGQFGSTKFAA